METKKLLLGIFIVCGIALTFSLFLILGVSEVFKPKITCVTSFKESVQGLETGAAVKYRGVLIGKVREISISPKDSAVHVVMEIILTSIQTENNNKEKINYNAVADDYLGLFTKEIQAGLRTRLEMVGITGMKYLELDYYEKPRPDYKVKIIDDVLTIPSTPSLFSDLKTNISDVFVKISQIDLHKTVTKIDQVLNSINSLVEDKKIQHILVTLEKISENLEVSSKTINETLTTKKIDELLTNVNNASLAIKSLAKKTEKELEAAQLVDTIHLTQDALKHTTKSIKTAFESFEKTSKSIESSVKNLDKVTTSTINDLKKEVTTTLIHLENTLNSVSTLVDNLDEDPGAIIQGKQKPQLLH